MDKFNVLLHTISRDLHPDDLEGLVHICGIDESRKAEIKSGNHLFKQLCHEARISEENVEYLKRILNTVKRCDLVRLVQEFQGVETTNDIKKDVKGGQTSSTDISSRPQRNSQADNCLGGLNNVEDSNAIADSDGSETFKFLHVGNRIDREGKSRIPCCTVNWSCLKMNCYKIHFCYVILVVIFSLGIIIVSLFWYAEVPKVSEHLNAEKSRKNAGLYVIIALLSIFLISLFIVFCARKYWETHHVTPVVISNTQTLANRPVSRGSIIMPKNEDPVPLVALKINPSCEVEMGNEPTTSGRYARSSHMAGDTEPILSP